MSLHCWVFVSERFFCVEVITEDSDAWPNTITREAKFDLESNQEVLLTFEGLKPSWIFKLQGPEKFSKKVERKHWAEQQALFRAASREQAVVSTLKSKKFEYAPEPIVEDTIPDVSPNESKSTEAILLKVY